jgi:hypothetical protein
MMLAWGDESNGMMYGLLARTVASALTIPT